MLYLCPEATCYKGLNSVTISKLKDNKSQFTINAGNVCRRAETGKKTPYIPTTQQEDTILGNSAHVDTKNVDSGHVNTLSTWPLLT
ncbi:hypothetical protein DSO57_1019041 [Entomophthora muscae]|uniref:Uncharacterized protein n=1 Tax=Entomophthora muscae TaxID=34485 RepID=A0ACC2SGZ1_9FUNG|nr:hypothetical protein DSO57_1019041 [Entomophthora muscae]